jgi:ribosomal protein L37AE/L43A
MKDYRQRNREALNKKQNEYKRKHEIETNGRTYRSKKDINRPDVCSICGTNKTKAAINFHHWEERPLTGIWVCRICHNVIHLRTLGNQTIEEWFKRYLEVRANPIVLDAKVVENLRGKK